MEKTNEVLKNEALDFLQSHKKMILTILDESGAPNSSLMLYAHDVDFNMYFGTCMCFGKYNALKKDGRVSMAIAQENIDPLQVVEEISSEKTDETLAWFTEHNTAKYYVKDAEDFVMFKITPKKVRWLDATSGELQINDLEL